MSLAKRTAAVALSGAFALTASAAFAAPKEITVAYFLEWPTANQVAQLEKTYDKAMGVSVKWRAFKTGVAMSAAMASNSVQISYSQGLVPFTLAVSKGLPIKIVGVAVSYAENDNCVVYKGANITKANAKDLEGKKVSVPIGTVAHYKMLRTLEHLKVDATKVKIVNMAPAEGAAALSRGDLAMSCGWGGALRRMKAHGKVLLTAAEQEAIGIRVFDVISVTNKFAKEHPELVTKFLQVTNDANKAYAANPDKFRATIAKAAGMKLSDSNQVIDLFKFPTAEEQRSKAWMGGTVQDFTKQVADFYVKQKKLPKALADYGTVIDASFLKDVK
ncbi:MAG: ABC transporter substrate-binding protein [Pseudomonadota bacterium]